jgi:hypothetical protein
MKPPWPERSFLARLLKSVRQRSNAKNPVAAVPVHYGTAKVVDLSARS